jgi:hypothetical protein
MYDKIYAHNHIYLNDNTSFIIHIYYNHSFSTLLLQIRLSCKLIELLLMGIQSNCRRHRFPNACWIFHSRLKEKINELIVDDIVRIAPMLKYDGHIMNVVSILNDNCQQEISIGINSEY